MPQVIFLPHEKFCPEGMVVEAEPGISILELAHEHHIEMESACGLGIGGPHARSLYIQARVVWQFAALVQHKGQCAFSGIGYRQVASDVAEF